MKYSKKLLSIFGVFFTLIISFGTVNYFYPRNVPTINKSVSENRSFTYEEATALIASSKARFNSDPSKAEVELLQLANDINKQMPITVDENTRMDRVSAGPGALFIFQSTVINKKSNDIDHTMLDRYLKTTVKNEVCSNPNMKIFFESGVTLGYSYTGYDGKFIGQVFFIPRDCGYRIFDDLLPTTAKQ